MDPILEEMSRASGPSDIKASRWRDWVQYLCALFAKQEDEIARLKAQLEEHADGVEYSKTMRGPGRPRKCQVCGEPETRHAATCAYVEAVARG
jgi:hypothetical protein